MMACQTHTTLITNIKIELQNSSNQSGEAKTKQMHALLVTSVLTFATLQDERYTIPSLVVNIEHREGIGCCF